MDRLAEEEETAAQQNDTKTLYNITRSCQVRRRVNTNKPVHKSNGTKTSDQPNEWKDYFSSLLNGIPVVSEEEDDLNINLGQSPRQR